MTQIQCTKVFKALSDDTRLKILKVLFKGESSVSDIACSTGVDYSQVSHHLGVLRNSGLVEDKKDGKFVIYKLQPVIQGKRKNVLDFTCCSIEFSDINILPDINS